MRTQFLIPDYFAPTQTLDFLRLPLPTLQPPPPLSLSPTSIFEHELLRCIDSSPIAVSIELESFPIDNALSKFFSDVLPHTIDVDNGFLSSDLRCTSGLVQVPEEEADLTYEQSATESWRTSNSGPEIKFSEEKIQESTGGKNENGLVVIQFETPELSQHLENACLSEGEQIQFLSKMQLQVCDDDKEMLNMWLSDPLYGDLKTSVETVSTISFEYDMEEKPQTPEHNLPRLNNVHTSDSIYPLFEVDEIGVEDSTWHSLEDELLTFIENIEVQQWTDNEGLELLGTVEINVLEHIVGNHTSKFPLDFHVESLKLSLEIDILQVVETTYSQRKIGMEDAYQSPLVEMFLFEEIEMLDSDSFETFGEHFISQVMKEPDTCNHLFHRDMNFKSFDELIVNSELAIIDETFTSLPVPVLMDDENTSPLHAIIDDILSELEPVPFPTSDEIYLDWHLLGKDKCDILVAVQKVFRDIEVMDINLKPNDGSLLVLEFLLSDDPLDQLSIEENNLDMTSGGSCLSELQNVGVASSRLSDDDCHIIASGRKLSNADSEDVESSKLLDDDCQIIENDGFLDRSGFAKSASHRKLTSDFNDLQFFLNPTKATGNMKSDHKPKIQDDKSMFSGQHHKEAVSANVGHKKQPDIQLHTVSLPANIMILIDKFRRSYLAVLRNNTLLNETEFSMDDPVDMNLLELSEEKLADYMRRSGKRQSCMGNWDDSTMNLVTLVALKRMVWCLCFFGFHTLHLFLRKLFQILPCLKSRLCSLYSSIEGAYREVEKEITKSHPSLASIKEILRQDTSRKNKVLILAQQFLWGPIKKLLTSMGISYTEIELSLHNNQQELCNNFFDAGARNKQPMACLLYSHEHISPSIFMQKFDIILEYGGPCGISNVSSLYRKYLGSWQLHFLKLELNDVAKALCEGVSVASNNRGTIKLEDLWNFDSLMANCITVPPEAAGKADLCSAHEPICKLPRESEPVQPGEFSFSDMIVVVNTQNFEKEMIISRRSTYQKILSMEKRGGQVVERDLILPVDIVVDATKCIAWYNCNNIGIKATSPDEGSCSIPLCIDNIAANVLTSLSFAFTACVLIFEGESNFLGAVMESQGQLYAAAASLGINLQIFCSYSSEFTDEIILNFIGHALKFCKGLLPRMPESETLAESFLTKFPSINPLSAHAIISSGCTLLEFLELPPEGRICILKKYHVPDESIDLLTALCKYGEREESKSGVTDCSSSVSSPPDSGKFVHKINSGDRKRKFPSTSYDNMYDLRSSKQSTEYMDDDWNYQSMSRKPMTDPKSKVPDLLDDELFGQGDVLDTGTNEDPSKSWYKPNVIACVTGTDNDPSKSWGKSKVTATTKPPQMRDGFRRSPVLLEDRFFDQQNSGGTTRRKRQEYDGDLLDDLHEDFIGEVVDIFDKPFSDVDFLPSEKNSKFTPFVDERVNDHVPTPSYARTARRLSFDGSHFPDFSMADEMNTRHGLKDSRQLKVDDVDNGVNYNWSNNSFQTRKESNGLNSVGKSIKNFTVPFPNEKDFSSYGETPLSKAVNSAQLQQGSPGTIEFLNRIKEKKRMRQQHQPSILEYFKYQGGSTPRKATKLKRQKQVAQPVNKKPSGHFPTWTPVDKKARQTLSFATSGTGGQTKLVSRENTPLRQDSRFRV